MNLDKPIKRFIAWVDKHGLSPAVMNDGGILQSGGCEKLPPLPDPGCCSDHVDLIELSDALRELVGTDGLGEDK